MGRRVPHGNVTSLFVRARALADSLHQGAPIAGYLLAAFGGQSQGFEAYRPAMYYAGSLALGSAGLVAMVRFHISRKIAAKV